jgi:hypothetical protein
MYEIQIDQPLLNDWTPNFWFSNSEKSEWWYSLNHIEIYGAKQKWLSHCGRSVTSFCRRNLDYQGIARRLLIVDALPQGVLPVYERDIDVAATVISSNGSGPESRVFGDRVTVPTFELFANPTVRISEVRRRRFNVLDRAVQKARQEIN